MSIDCIRTFNGQEEQCQCPDACLLLAKQLRSFEAMIQSPIFRKSVCFPSTSMEYNFELCLNFAISKLKFTILR